MTLPKNNRVVKKLRRILFSRVVLLFFLILLQALWIIINYLKIVKSIPILASIMQGLAVFFIIYIQNSRHQKQEYKILWVAVILLFPIVGVPSYYLFAEKRPGQSFRKRLEKASEKYHVSYLQDSKPVKAFKKYDERGSRTSRYIFNEQTFPVYQNTDVTYYKTGEELVEGMIKDLMKAEHFIFMEYFTIDFGKLWEPILEILTEKAKQGVEVRILYDDFGSIKYIPVKYYKTLEKIDPHIKCMKFNRMIPFFSVFMNNRDHRKMTIIDGHVSFTGGLNISDRYVNITHPFGQWKDAGVRIHGDATWNMTLMFLEMWDAVKKNKKIDNEEEKDIRDYMPHRWHTAPFYGEGFVQPYGDEPFDDIDLSENVYLDLIAQAKKNLYIYTPYLILSEVLCNNLCMAAKCGVDVRIVTPGIPDKKLVYRLTRASYDRLLQAGVRVYEYTPGFIHSKCMLCDDNKAIVGTVNFDYRSLFLHFEDAVYFAGCPAVKDLMEDMKETFKVCHEVTEEDRKQTMFGRFFDSVLVLMAPLL